MPALFRRIRAVSRLLLMVVILSLSWPAWAQSPAASNPRPALYDFGMGKCLSCQLMEKVLEAVKSKYGGQLEVRLIYLDQEKDLFRRHQIMAVPTQVFLDASGKEVHRHLGLFPQDELVKKLKELKFIKD